MTKPTKIAVVVHSLRPGGAELVACRLAMALSSWCEFLIIALDGEGSLTRELEQRGIRYMVMNRNRGLDWDLVNKLGMIFHSEHIHLAHAHQYTPFIYSMLARSRGHGLPIVFTEHGRHVPDRRGLRRLFANRLLLHGQDRVTAVARSVAQALVKHEGIAKARITVIPNGVDTTKYSPPDQSERLRIRNLLGLHAEWFIIVMVARLDPLKDHITALRAFEHLVAHYPRARLLLVGDGVLGEQLRNYTKSRHLDSLVTFCGEQSEVLPYYKCADCFLLTSISEGMPLSVLEAMACGLPVVATRCGDIPQIVEHGLTGFLAAPKDDALLAYYLLELAGCPDMRARMGLAARLVCNERYSWPNTVAQYKAVYTSVLLAEKECYSGEYIRIFR